MISLVHRYVFIEWVKIFALVLGAMFGLQMIVEIQDSFGDLLSFEAKFTEIVFYYAVLAPSFLTISLPAAVLVSILYALGLLHRNNEIIAFRAAGMSVFQVTSSIWLAGLGMSALLWTLNASLIPWSVEQSTDLIERLEWRKQAESEDIDRVGLVENLAFDNRKENRLWFMNRFSEYAGTGYGISLSFMDRNRHETRRILARSGFFERSTGKWTFEDGRDNYYAVADGELIRTVPFEKLELKTAQDDPKLMLLFGEKPQDLSFFELKAINDNFTIEENPRVMDYRARYHALMASAASCLIVVGIAIPFAVSGVRVNPAVGVSKSIALFFGYYVLTSVLAALGKQGTLSPSVAAWSPIVFMIIVAYVLVRRVR